MSPNRLNGPPPRLEVRAHVDLEGLVVGHADDAREGLEPIAVRIRRPRRVLRDEVAAGEAAHEDTDDPAVSLDFLRAHGIVYASAGLALFTMAGGLARRPEARTRHRARARSTCAV